MNVEKIEIVLQTTLAFQGEIKSKGATIKVEAKRAKQLILCGDAVEKPEKKGSKKTSDPVKELENEPENEPVNPE